MTTALAILDRVLNSIWQVGAMTALVWFGLKFMPRINAATRYAIWWAVLGVALVASVAPRPPLAIQPPEKSPATESVTAREVHTRPVSTEFLVVAVAPGRPTMWLLAVLVAWVAVLLSRLVRIGQSYLFLRGVKSRGRVSHFPIPTGRRCVRLLTSSDIVSPMAAGFLRPAIIVPESLFEKLSESEREHVVLHELAHLARYDDWTNLAMRILGAVLALHPVAIWILRELERQREIACDDWAVARTGAARSYAASLVRLFELREVRNREVLAPGILDSKSRLGRRIEMLLGRGRVFSAHASPARIVATALVMGTLMLAGSLAPPWIAFAQQQPRVAFEVASLRPSSGGQVFIGLKSPGTFSADNVSLRGLIMEAYGIRAFQIAGGPAWTRFDKYDVTAKPKVNTTLERGITRESTTKELAEMDLMLRFLLEDRFKLTVHRQTKDLPVYILGVAKGGIKVRKSTCVQADPSSTTSHTPDEKPSNICGASRYGTNGLNRTLDWTGTNMADFTRWALPTITGRTVVDKTGYTGIFDIHLEWTPSELQDIAAESKASNETEKEGANSLSIFTALPEQLGLSLKSGKGPVDALVIDHVERPSGN